MKPMMMTFAAAAISVSFASASVTIVTGATGVIRDSASSMVPLGSIGVMVADVDGDNLVNAFGTTLAIGNTFGSSGGDLIVGLYQASNLTPGQATQAGFDLSGTTFNYSGSFGAGDALWLVWFPSISTLNATVTAGTSYGTFRTTQIDSLGTMAWIAPADGTDQQLFSLDAALGGNPAVSESSFTATFTAVPEPSIYGLVGVALLGFIFWRRRFVGARR